MDKAINSWAVLLIVILVAMGYGFGVYQVKTFMPVAAAQVAANKAVVADVTAANQNLIKQVNDAFIGMDKRVSALEKK